MWRLVLMGAVLALALGGTPAAQAWNPTGHMLIASMTFDQLPPETRARWAELLRKHPDFEKWRAAEPIGEAGFDEGRYLFMRAATWPDDVRKTGSPYDHPSWHHIDYPLEGPDFAEKSAPESVEDALFAISRCRAALGDAKASEGERAACLSWLIHVVSDLQQPMHCGTFVAANYPPPEGDRNGLSRFFSVGGAPISLHWFWDCLPGTTLDQKEIVERGRQLMARFPREALPELTAAVNPKAWSLEGRALCVEAVYRRGAVGGLKEDRGAQNPALPEGYAAAAHAVAERRVALAMWRLAEILSVPLAAPRGSD